MVSSDCFLSNSILTFLMFTCFALFTLKPNRATLFCQHFETWRTAVTCLIAWIATTKLLVLNHKAKLVKLSYLLKVAVLFLKRYFQLYTLTSILLLCVWFGIYLTRLIVLYSFVFIFFVHETVVYRVLKFE